MKEDPKKIKNVWMRKDLKDHNKSELRGETLGIEASQPCGVEKVLEMGIGAKVQDNVQTLAKEESLPKKGDVNGSGLIQKDTITGENNGASYD